MKTTDKFGNVHYAWEEEHGYENPMEKEMSPGKLHLLRLGSCLLMAFFGLSGIIHAAVRAYLYLFPNR